MSAAANFAAEFDVPVSVESMLGNAMREFVPFFGRYKYEVISQTTAGITLKRRYMSGWGFFLGLVTLPLGLLIWAFMRSTQTVSLTFTAIAPAQTRVVIAGQGPREVREYATALQHQAAPVVVGSD
jgi:hypothetical protein